MSRPDTALPVIDLAQLDGPHQDEFYKNLRHVARDIGFFYLVGHGVSSEEFAKLLSTAKAFFALDESIKATISMENSRHFRGYTKTGVERTLNRPDYREQIDIGEELAPLPDIPEDQPWLNLIGPNQWPAEVPELRSVALKYQSKLRGIATKLLKAFLTALELPADSLDILVEGPNPQTLLKLVHYPSNDCSTADGNTKVQGCGAHKDSDILTLLWQDEVGGLQVETDKGWIDVPPMKDAFVVNIGEVLELATNGYLVANIHQVVRPPRSVSRYSIAYFLAAKVSAMEVPQLKLPEELAAVAKGPAADPQNPLFSCIGKNVIKGRLRSHVAVTKRFYNNYYDQIIKHGNIK